METRLCAGVCIVQTHTQAAISERVDLFGMPVGACVVLSED